MRDYKTWAEREIFEQPTLDALKDKIEGYYKLPIHSKVRKEEYVTARIVFTLMAYNLGFSHNYIGKYIGLDRTTVSVNRHKYMGDPHYTEQIRQVQGHRAFEDQIDEVAMHSKFLAIKEELDLLGIDDMESLKEKMRLMIKSKQWKHEKEGKFYEGSQSFLMD